MSINLTQVEAQGLMMMPKRSLTTERVLFPALGGKLSVELESLDRTENFLLDVTRSYIDLSKINYQNRGRAIIILLRLDLNGPPHRNPDDQIIPCPHLHVYREGFGDKWAQPVPSGEFSDLDDSIKTLLEFMAVCNIVEPPTIQAGLF